MIKILQNFQKLYISKILQVIKSVKNHLFLNQKLGAKCPAKKYFEFRESLSQLKVIVSPLYCLAIASIINA